MIKPTVFGWQVKKLVEVGWAVATKSHIALAPWEESKRDKFRKSVV